jgi:DNA-directed RNA polymerase subunit L
MILPSNTTMEHSWDLKIGGDCYTVGKILEWVLYVSYYLAKEMGGKMEVPVMSFCAFRKAHPHDDEATLRIAFVEETDKGEIQGYLLAGLNESRKVVRLMDGLFV